MAQLAREFGVSWHAAMEAVRRSRPTARRPPEPPAHAARHRHRRDLVPDRHRHSPDALVTGFVDLDRHRLIDVVPGRSAAAVSDWLGAKPEPWLAGIATVVIDPYAGYARGLADLPRARLVVDHFHAVRLANQSLDEVRRRVQQTTLGHRGWKGDPLYGIRRRLLTAYDRLGARGYERMLVLLEAGDPAARWPPPTWPRSCMREVSATSDSDEPTHRLRRFYDQCRRAEVRELTRLARTVRRWQSQILAWHVTGLTNGPTEAVNLLVKKIKRVGHGFRNFENYRLRLLLHCGVQWQTRPTASMRARHPRLAA